MLTISVVDIIPILFCLAGLIIPQFYSRTTYAAIVTIVCMFLFSFIGAWVVHTISAQDFGTVFSRLFLLIGVSHVTFISVQSSMYWKLVLERVGYIKKPEEHV